MSTVVQIPDFNFSSFYYNEILTALINYRRVNVPEITDENEYEPFVQLERAFALVGHLNNVLLDFAAKETLLPTSTQRSSVRSILKLIGYEISEATPATVDLILELAKVFNSGATYIPVVSQFATRAEGEVEAVVFENLDAFTLIRTDRASSVFGLESSVFTDYTVKAYTPADPFTPWASAAAGDMLYVAHQDIMWDKLAITLSGAGSGITGVWEYYDGDFEDMAPDGVSNLGSQLRFDLTSLLGATDLSGAIVRVTLNSTGAFEDVASLWNGSINYIDTSFLGQTSPSISVNDYTVGTDWHSLEATDGTSDFQSTGDVDYDLPQTLLKEWIKSTVNGNIAYWARYRIISVSTPSSPSIDLVDIDQGKQYALAVITQGLSRPGEILGSSSGQAGQSYKTLRDGVIQSSSVVYVDAAAWTEVQNFLNSDPADKHYVFEVDDDGFGVVKFSDGINGKIPPIGVDNITIDYRVGADQDGNVGRDLITINRSGVAFINRMNNPRPAVGWALRRGSTPADLELVKLEGPASLRTLNRGVTLQDIEDLAVAFVTSTGSSPVSRALAVEEGFGVKTVEAVLVGVGGSIISSSIKQELEDYFNGDLATGIDGIIVVNHRVFTTDYQPRSIDVTATVYGGNEIEIKNVLTAVLQPETKTADGLRFEWEFGEEVPRSRLISEIFTVAGVRKVVLTTPATDVTLLARELPVVGALTITVEP